MQTTMPRIALITGGGAGIGLAAARAFAAAGTRAIITGRNEARLATAAWQTPGIDYVVADAASEADAERTIATIIQRWGRLDVLVNNAGAGAILPLAQAGADRIAAIFATNVIGPSLLTRAALPHLKAAAGAIVNVSSTFGRKADERARIPMGRRGEPEDIAPWIVSLATPGSVWITGQILRVDGGLAIA